MKLNQLSEKIYKKRKVNINNQHDHKVYETLAKATNLNSDAKQNVEQKNETLTMRNHILFYTRYNSECNALLLYYLNQPTHSVPRPCIN